jgi:hypothetical protein
VLTGSADRPGHHRHDGTRIDAAGQERTERHLGDHAQPHALAEPLEQFRLCVFGVMMRRREAHVPVLLRRRQRPASRRTNQRVRGRQLERGTEDGARLGHVAEREVVLDSVRIDAPLQRAVRQQRLELGAEQQVPVRQQRVVQRLHAEPVAREEQRLPVLVPQREREHAAEAVHAGFAPGFPAWTMTSVSLRVWKVWPSAVEFRDQRLVVVDLAVEHDDDAAVLVVERLLAGRQIDDRKPPVPETDARRQCRPPSSGPR